MIDFLLFNIYGHGIVIISVLFLITILTLLDSAKLILYGSYALLTWLLIEVIFIVRAEYFWSYIGYLTLTGIAVFIGWVLLIHTCEKVGRSYNGEGAILIIVPVTSFPLFIGLSIITKGIMLIWNYLFG